MIQHVPQQAFRHKLTRYFFHASCLFFVQQISFEEFVNGMRRMRGSSVQKKNGLLSQSSADFSASQPTDVGVDPGDCEDSTRSTGKACSVVDASCGGDVPVADTAESKYNQYQGVPKRVVCVGEPGDVNKTGVERNGGSGDGKSIDTSGSTSKPLGKGAEETGTKGGEGMDVRGEMEGWNETRQAEARVPLADDGGWPRAGKEGGGVHMSGCVCIVS